MNIGNYHGGGSPIMEQIAITTSTISSPEKLVKYIAGMSGGDREVFSKKTSRSKDDTPYERINRFRFAGFEDP